MNFADDTHARPGYFRRFSSSVFDVPFLSGLEKVLRKSCVFLIGSLVKQKEGQDSGNRGFSDKYSNCCNFSNWVTGFWVQASNCIEFNLLTYNLTRKNWEWNTKYEKQNVGAWNVIRTRFICVSNMFHKYKINLIIRDLCLTDYESDSLYSCLPQNSYHASDS